MYVYTYLHTEHVSLQSFTKTTHFTWAVQACACMTACVYVCGVYVCTYVVCMCVRMWCVCVYVCGVYVCTYVVCMCVRMWCVCVYVCGVYVCTYVVCMCVRMWCVCVYPVTNKELDTSLLHMLHFLAACLTTVASSVLENHYPLQTPQYSASYRQLIKPLLTVFLCYVAFAYLLFVVN